ncbi:MAG TPA: SIS domain-containing protein [Terriglobales bacterium]|nr:SIS domain-containing protein [Terriglobales bacterium]
MTFSTTVGSSDWLQQLCDRQPEAAKLLLTPADQQKQRGYFHTLREILQQPSTWIKTSEQMVHLASTLAPLLAGICNLNLTGSGSSEYAGDCVRFLLQSRLGVSAIAVGGGVLLTNGIQSLPPERPGLVVSLARSGDSPESVGALSLLLEMDPGFRHLVLTCNKNGKLATKFRGHSGVQVIALDDATNDRSLVMTSSFTNIVVAALSLGFLDSLELYQEKSRQLSATAIHLLGEHFDTISRAARSNFKRAVFLGTGSRFGAAREAALKMLEMTAGKISAMPETYLGLRHGPMSYVDANTIVVCFLSSNHTARAYECDLLRELDQKNLGSFKLILGEDVPEDVVREQDVILNSPGLNELGDDWAAVVDVMVGQLLGFFRCLHEGLRPDSPSESGVINRVVQSFELHLPGTMKSKQSPSRSEK